MERKEFIKITSLLSATAIVNPESLFAQSWIIDILEELGKAILVELSKEPIEDFLREILGLPKMAKDIKKKMMNMLKIILLKKTNLIS